jgi:hypothetical protein
MDAQRSQRFLKVAVAPGVGCDQAAAMDRTPLQSSAVVSAGYDADTQTLELEFSSGRVYRYEGVPQGTYDWLLRAPSKGAFVARMINDRYAYRDVTPPSEAQAQDLGQALRASLLARGERD